MEIVNPEYLLLQKEINEMRTRIFLLEQEMDKQKKQALNQWLVANRGEPK